MVQIQINQILLGKYLLEISMNSQADSMNTVTITLIKTNKIDLNIKLNASNNDQNIQSNQYFIHIAVYINNSSILERILKKFI